MNAAPQIRGVGVVSAIGVGWPAFAEALRKGAAQAPRQATPALRGTTPWPETPAHWLADFDARSHLGDKGLSALDRTTQLAVVACKQALGERQPAERNGVGVVLGSMGGGMRSIADFVRSTYTAAPHMVSPMQFPNTVMNCAAGQCAIWHGLHGVNSTVCAGELSGLAALQYASRMLRLGHASCLLTGSVEEYCDFTAWSHEGSEAAAQGPLGEGGAVFALSAANEDGSAPAMAELLAVRMRTVPGAGGRLRPDDEALAVALAGEIGRVLQDACTEAAALRWWAGRGRSESRTGAVERHALVLAGLAPDVVAVPPRVLERCGHSYAASVSLQLAGALALAPPGLGLITAISRQGQVGCALLRQPAPAGRH